MKKCWQVTQKIKHLKLYALRTNGSGTSHSCEVVLLYLFNSWKVEAENIFCYL